jgi:transcriptional regulator GlxA family with amidase domain
MKVAFFIFPGFQLLDLAGPLAAFEIAKRFHAATPYRPVVVAERAGPIASSSGVAVEAKALGRMTPDTLIITGGDDTSSACIDHTMIAHLNRAAHKARRVASICTGAFLLAETGLLNGKRVTTHWRFAPELKQKHPQIKLESDRIFIRDGRFWTSAGITAGIDLSLALIADDFGEEIAKKVAQDLVVYQRRPGGQSQFSALLEIDTRSERIALALAYAREHLTAPLSVDELAAQTSLSPRQFARVFTEETGLTPAKAVERLRVEAASVRIEENRSESLQEVADTTGFKDLERMRRAFVRFYGHPPQAHRRLA